MKKLYQQPEMEVLCLTMKESIATDEFDKIDGVSDYIGAIMSDPGFEDGVEDEW